MHMYQGSGHAHFKTVVRLPLSRSALVCLSSDLTYSDCVFYFLFALSGQQRTLK